MTAKGAVLLDRAHESIALETDASFAARAATEVNPGVGMPASRVIRV